MKVYVDEMPRRCLDCICLCSFNDGEQSVYKCPFNDSYISEENLYYRKNCCLKKQKFIKNKKLSKTHDDRVRADERKKVCEEIQKELDADFRIAEDYCKISRILKNIEKGKNDGSVGD